MSHGRPAVMKFGGTSVEDAAAFRRVGAIVGERLALRPVVVVSAMSRFTDSLVRAVARAAGGDSEAAMRDLEEPLERHRAVAAELLDAEARRGVEERLALAASDLAEVLRVIARHPGTRPSLGDEVVSHGERLSSLLLAAVLRAEGAPGVFVDARACVLTDDEHGRAAPLPGTGERVRRELLPLLAEGAVPVLGGFIGSTADGATTTLGRGGSDYTAALVGAALDAREIQIWTDVTGFLTADPRLVAGARNLAHLSYEEAAELAFFGARVLHPKTIQPAVEREIPVRVLNSRQPGAEGTRIDARAVPSPEGIKAVAHKRGVTVVRVSSTRMLGAFGFLQALFDVFGRHRTAVDVVSTSEVSVSLTVEHTRALPAILDELSGLGTAAAEEGYAIVCLVGEGLRATPGVAARVFGTLREINVEMISQGASPINLTFVVREEDAVEAVRRLHAEFFEA
jgi:aspartate kinase